MRLDGPTAAGTDVRFVESPMVEVTEALPRAFLGIAHARAPSAPCTSDSWNRTRTNLTGVRFVETHFGEPRIGREVPAGTGPRNGPASGESGDGSRGRSEADEGAPRALTEEVSTLPMGYRWRPPQISMPIPAAAMAAAKTRMLSV